jgi:hypothetical protein
MVASASGALKQHWDSESGRPAAPSHAASRAAPVPCQPVGGLITVQVCHSSRAKLLHNGWYRASPSDRLRVTAEGVL